MERAGRKPPPAAATPPASLRAAMAEVQPLTAVHYDPARVAIGDVVAPPYDVIDAAGRARAAGALALQRRRARPAADRRTTPTPTSTPRARCRSGRRTASSSATPEPTIWAYEQDYTGPDGAARTRRGFLARIRVTPTAPASSARTSAPSRARRRTGCGSPARPRHSMSPIFVLHAGDAWSLIAAALAAEPWAETTDADGTVNRVWPIADPAVHEALAGLLEPSELLIADGHHRYETARTYGEEIGGEGPHRYTLACLVSLEDPGLSVFATHRLLHDLDTAKQEAIRDTLTSMFEIAPAPGPDAGGDRPRPPTPARSPSATWTPTTRRPTT